MIITRTQSGVGFQLTQEMIDKDELPEDFNLYCQVECSSGFTRPISELTVGTWVVEWEDDDWQAYTPAEFKEMGFKKGEEDE